MSRRCDYKCEECGKVVERYSEDFPDGNFPSFILSDCEETGKHYATMKRVWSAPHIGPGSNGEPARWT